MAWQQRDARRCRCGQDPDEWRKYDEHGRPVFENGAHVADPDNEPFRVTHEWCPACYALEQAEKKAPKVDGAVSRAVVTRWEPNPGYVPRADKLAGLVEAPAEDEGVEDGA